MANLRDRNGHGLLALRVVGALLPPEFLQTVSRLEAKHQNETDYGLSKSLALKDELARYWRIANDLYAGYVERRDRAGLDRSRVGVDEWLVPLIKTVFGYEDLASAHPATIGDRTFRITHRALEKTVPMALTVREVDLDRADPRFGEEARRQAAHGVMQDLLNADDRCLWGLISNGVKLRILRNNPTLTRPAYIEADLERMFEEQLYADFTTLWLTAHASRLRPVDQKPSECILEMWRRQAHETGERALEHLRDGVTVALNVLGNGFLRNPENEGLRLALADGSFDTNAYFQELLRLVYRLLFLFTAEERHLLYLPSSTEQDRSIYHEGYSLSRLRERALRRRHYDRHSDLWQGLGITFAALANGATQLALPALGGLFSADQCRNLDRSVISNEALLEALRALAYFRAGMTLARVNYRDMDTEELGSVYESLLELHPYVAVNASPWTFGFINEDRGETNKGSARKVSGSYYTPAVLVNNLIVSVLEPVIAHAVEDRPEDPRRALLDLRVLDPACGSGHFLLAAARRIAAEIARLDAGLDAPNEAARQHALREVVQHCIYGVDRNPLAVELCKAALWIETVEPGKPLTFLDPHIQCGDSLVGVLDRTLMTEGIPDEAYKRLTGDDDAVCSALKAKNKRSKFALQTTMFDPETLKTVGEASSSIDLMPEDTVEEITAKRLAWEATRGVPTRLQETLRSNIFVGAFFAPKTAATLEDVPTNEDLRRAQGGMPIREEVDTFVSDLAKLYRFFHWHVAFADIMHAGGFDAILGNPPWDVSQLNEEEYFANRDPSISRLHGAQRKKAICALAKSNSRLWDAYQRDMHAVESANAFSRQSGRFVLTSRGKINTYALFAELFLGLLSRRGRGGIIVPSELLSGDAKREYFQDITVRSILKTSIAFENEEFIFPGIANVNRFALITLGPEDKQQDRFVFAFYLRKAEDLAQSDRFVTLTRADFKLLNPNTRTSPVFRSTADAALTRGLYSRVPVLINDNGHGGNPWGLRVRQGLFNMTSGSALFRTTKDLMEAGNQRDGLGWVDESSQTRYMPLYEGKFIWHYDHRFGSYHNLGKVKGRGGRGLPPVSLEEHSDPRFFVEARYWVQEAAVEERLVSSGWLYSWLLGWRDVATAKLERTFVTTVLPRVAVGNKIYLYFPTAEPVHIAALLANLSSLIFDYIVRQKMAGTSLAEFYFKQLPAFPPSAYDRDHLDFILPRVLELSYTSEALRPFAIDLGFAGSPFKWDVDRRARLQAELDALFAYLYGLTRDQLVYILDPGEVYGPMFPSETFRVLKEREIKELGEYRTARLLLGAWDRFMLHGTFAKA